MSAVKHDTGREWPDDLDTDTTAFFERSIAAFQCRECGAEFRIQSVYSSAKIHHGPNCPICDAEADVLERRAPEVSTE